MYKQLLLSLLLFLCCLTQANTQSINEIQLSKIDADYIRIVSNQDESDIYIDLGSKYNAPRFNSRLAAPELRNIIKDKEGHEIIFASTIDAMNFMHKNGYTLVQTQNIMDDKVNVYHYIMKKKTNLN